MAMQNIEGRIPGPSAHAPMEPITLSDQNVDGIERRISATAVQYWRELAAPRRYPSRTQVTNGSAPGLWDNFFIVKVGPDAAEHVFEYCGSVLREALGSDPTGKKVGDALPREIVGRALYFQRAACDLMAPIDEAGRFTRNSDNVEVMYRAVLLPLSENQREATYLLGAFSFRTLVNH